MQLADLVSIVRRGGGRNCKNGNKRSGGGGGGGSGTVEKIKLHFCGGSEGAGAT